MAELQGQEISTRIKQAREEAGLTQPQLAMALGVTTRAFQNYENPNHRTVPWHLLGRIGDVTGHSKRWLLHGDESDATPSAEVLERLGQLEQMLRERAERERTLERKLDLLLSNLSAAEPIKNLLDDMESRQPDAEAAPRTKRKRQRSGPRDS